MLLFSSTMGSIFFNKLIFIHIFFTLLTPLDVLQVFYKAKTKAINARQYIYTLNTVCTVVELVFNHR